MKKEIKKLTIPKCPKCKKLMEVFFTTEKEDDDSPEKPKVLIAVGECEECKMRLVFDLIETDKIPGSPEEVMKAMECSQKLSSEKGCGEGYNVVGDIWCGDIEGNLCSDCSPPKTTLKSSHNENCMCSKCSENQANTQTTVKEKKE